MAKIVITIDNDLPLTSKQIAQYIEDRLFHYNGVEVTVTPETIDVHKGKQWSDIELSPSTVKKLKEIGKLRDIDTPEQVLRRGMDRLKEK